PLLCRVDPNVRRRELLRYALRVVRKSVGNRSATTLLRTTRRAYRSTHGEVNHATPRRLHPCCSRRPRARRLSGYRGSAERPALDVECARRLGGGEWEVHRRVHG